MGENNDLVKLEGTLLETKEIYNYLMNKLNFINYMIECAGMIVYSDVSLEEKEISNCLNDIRRVQELMEDIVKVFDKYDDLKKNNNE